ncbi:restriction endonuclease [Streptomyces specialis]|uniref:restriction endonuclease n=1 Tax=Streptomyces specialis TaxID=498367 RepID=UPI00073E6446|nr:restriction endonuclease [Streptomyces specialis]
MSRRSDGLITAWAQAQRQQQLRERAAYQAWARERREEERRLRTREREQARTERERHQAYRRGRGAGARRRTEELEARVAELGGLLVAGCAAPPVGVDGLRQPETVAEFAPGPLARPVPMPDPARYHATGRRAQAEARARYERDWYAAQTAEAQRLRQLADYQQEYDRWARTTLEGIRRHNASVETLIGGLGRAEPGAVVDWFTAALYAGPVWPRDFPRQVEASYDAAARQLVLEWELPGYDVVPAAKAVRYVVSSDQERETARPVTQRRALYQDVLAQSMLLVLRDVFTADTFRTLDSVALNGFVDDNDPATGRRTRIVLASVSASRTVFDGLRLAQVSAVDCLTDALGGRISARPDQCAAVRPARRPEEVGQNVLGLGGEGDPDLFTMDPVAFEGLVQRLFLARGMRAVTTELSGDGGVDVDAFDPDPISGGRIIVQVKRYRNTVPPTAVRDLYGTVLGAGANKGILVTTSGFGPGSYAFAEGKPLTLISGPELVGLLGEAGLPGRLGDGGAAPAPSPTPEPEPGPGPEAGHNVLGVLWGGPVALDVCALVCRGGRVLGDDHFVFYNNPRTPDGSVRSTPASAPDRAALRVAFDALPGDADRLVVVAAIDPEADPHADLSGFTDARIRLCDASGTELDRLEVSDGRPGETALVLGSFRRRANGDWAFVAGGKGYPGGLAPLLADHGIDAS